METSSLDSSHVTRAASQVSAGVDEAHMVPTTGSTTDNEADKEAEKPGLDTAEQQGLKTAGMKPTLPKDGVPIPLRPSLKRERSVPAPQQPPAPAPPQPLQDPGAPTDSLSLVQLRKLVTEMPRVEPTPYAFVYQDASSLPEELEEWFSYGVEERAMLLKTQSSFAQEWCTYNGHVHVNALASEDGEIDWVRAEPTQRAEFVRKMLASLRESDTTARMRSLETLVYIVLGCWHETAGLPASESRSNSMGEQNLEESTGALDTEFAKSAVQIDWMLNNVRIIHEHEGVQAIFDVVRTCCLRECATDSPEQDMTTEQRETQRRETWCALTLLYVIVEVTRAQSENENLASHRADIIKLRPNLLLFLTEVIDKLRWDDSIDLPLPKILLLTWKTILVTFGGIPDVERAKASFRDDSLEQEDKRGQPLITASPLDYHLFRQEISSKYPSYNPPPPLFPLEPDNNSILPPLKQNINKTSINGVSNLSNDNGYGASILHQPVHIATPAPSPPPSPAGPGGKGGKKQNYQTNQLFPFLYPPLDESSNNLGGKGTTDLQDALVGRKWKGSDIPASILEAAELFAKRMRATRAMKQLWEERVEFMKYERGYRDADDLDVEHLELSPKSDAARKKVDNRGPAEGAEPAVADTVEARLQLVESFYRDGLSHLQSVVMVLLKVILSNVTALITQANGQNGLQSAFQLQETQNGTTANKLNPNVSSSIFQPDTANSTTEELDAVRSQEITAKAVSGILILLLKWFKVSHILKFEYLTQLLVDANYIPLILKLMQSQEVERIVNYKCDREDLNFFHFCRAHSRVGIDLTDDTSDYDGAAPPPVIKRHRDDANPDAPPDPPDHDVHPILHPPEVDELGIPTTELPSSPITHFSWRNFFSSINFLRILQKICKGKAHRNLLLVSYKSSQFLKKSLKVPQPELRLYALKLFKNQVPYCGRKWRSTNMRVITAVYLHCRPELRDDWLAGSDVDAEVEESLPLEQALRALTHWYNLKRYPHALGADKGILEEEQDFFVKELEKMEWAEDANVGEEAQGEQGWEGPLQVEGW